MSQYFPNAYERSNGNTKIELNLSNFVTKVDLKQAAGVDTSDLTAKLDIASSKVEVDKTHIGKQKITSSYLRELSNVVYNDGVKTMYMVN